MSTLVLFLVVVVSFIAGMCSLLGYILYRMMKHPQWDDSNVTNALRLLSHVTLHPTDFKRMYYLSPIQVARLFDDPTVSVIQPFWYVDKDEFAGVVRTRPPRQ